MGKVLVIGSSMYDLVTYTDIMPKAGETLTANSFKMGFGGKGANQAIAAAKLGSDVAMVAAVGDDSFGDMMYQNFKSNDIDTQFVYQIPNQSSGIATIIVDETSQNRILIVKGANLDLTKQNIDDALANYTEIDFLILQLEIDLEIVYYAIEQAKKMGIPILFNPAPAAKGLNLDIITQVDILVPNETELEILSAMPTSNMIEIKQAAQSLLNQGIGAIIVTLGAKGALYLTKESEILVAAPKVNAIDTTGAGDAFIGAFVSEYSVNKDIEGAIKFAIGYASLSTTKKGTQTSYISKDEYLA
ncbi:MAG: ribokinase [Alphaproteobacteria bacterium]